MDAKRPHFFEGFDPSSSSERLKIPSRFIKHMEGKTSGTVSLLGPSGNTWHVSLFQHSGNLFFHDGWAAFVDDHSVECGDAMVFRYDGNLHFTVQVFDQSKCEKEDAFSAGCSQDPSHLDKILGRKRERVGASSRDSIFVGVPKKMRGSHVQSECRVKNQEERWQCEESGYATETCQTAIYAHDTVDCASPSRNAVSFALPLQSQAPQNYSEATIRNGNGKDSELSDCMLKLLASEAEGLARSFTSCYPNFTKTMKRFNVSGSYTLNIPYQFSMAHLPDCKVKIVLHNLKGESWTVNSIPTVKVHMSHTLCGGWMAFVRDNYINVGDICIFELVEKCELRVYVLRVGKEELEFQNGKAAVTGLANGSPATSHMPKKKKGKVHLQLANKVKISSKTNRNQEAGVYHDKENGRSSKNYPFCSQSKASKGKLLTQNKVSSEEKLGSYTRICMSMKSAPEEKIAAQSFVSSFPHFVRVMKKFNICGSYTLKIPYKFSMEHLPDYKTEIILRNLRGQCWTVNSVPSTRVQTLHTFCGGWMAFVRGNDIQIGDICIFELIGKFEMRVHITGLGKNDGEYQDGKATSDEFTLAKFGRNRPLLLDV